MSTTPSSQLSLVLESSTQRSPLKGSPANKKLFIGGLSVKVGETLLHKYFEQFGEIERLVIVKDQGVSKGYGFVTFKDPKDAHKATQGRHYLGDKSFSCTYLLTEKQAKKQTLADKERKLFLKNLSFSTKEHTVKAYFERFGAVERVTINRNLDETSKGSGFVLFEEPAAARSLLKHKSTHQIDGRSVKVYATLTKQEIKEYSARLEQVQRASPVSVRNELVSLVHRNSKASAATFSSQDESAPELYSSEFQNTSLSKNKQTIGNKWQRTAASRLFDDFAPKIPAKTSLPSFLTCNEIQTPFRSFRLDEFAFNEPIYCVVGANHMMPTNCLSHSARNMKFKAHTENSSNLVFRYSHHRVSVIKVQESSAPKSQ